MVCKPATMDDSRLRKVDQKQLVESYKSMLFYEESCDYLHQMRQNTKQQPYQ